MRPRVLLALAVIGLLAVGVGTARPDRAATVKLTMLMPINAEPGWDVLVPNFERVYPEIDVQVDYLPNNAALYTAEPTELLAGSGPDLLATSLGCGTPIAVCTLGKGGYLAQMVKKPWAMKRSVPLVTSYAKYKHDLVAFIPQVAPVGLFTNDTMFAKLGLKVPQTFPQLLDICRKAKAAGTSAIVLSGGSATTIPFLTVNLAIPTVYNKDPRWLAKSKAGKVTFAGSRGWHLALQRFVDMNAAECFQPGFTGVSSGTGAAELFAQGRSLMYSNSANNEGNLAGAHPQFTYSFHRFPAGSSATETTTLITLLQGVSINAHSSARDQAAAQTFVDFVARPKQNALFTRATGGLSQDQLRKSDLPGFMSSMQTVFAKKRYMVNPIASWWNQATLEAMQKGQIGLITGQRSIDDVLKSMDAAWKQGPS